jgi:glyceraldehyde 3-phosphate dehydrogenase
LQRNSYEDYGSVVKKASETTMKIILGYTEDLVVSQDLFLDSRTSLLMQMLE